MKTLKSNGNKKRLMTISQLAKIKGITRQGLRKSLVEGRLKYKSYKLGNQWIIEV